MPLPDIDANRGPDALLKDILAYIDEAESLVVSRNLTPLAGLDTVVEALCARVLAMPAETSGAYAEQLDNLMQRLDGLQTKMSVLSEEVATTIKSLGVQQKANRAYKKPEA